MNQESRKLWKKFFVVFVLVSCFLMLNSEFSFADTSQGDGYIMQMHVGTDTTGQNLPYNKPGSYIIKQPGKPTATPSSIPLRLPTASPTPPPLSVELGYRTTQQPFEIDISNNIVDFGPLSPTDFITRTSSFSVKGDPLYLYSIVGFEDHTLENAKQQPIPGTRCDDGKCTSTIASDWTDTLTFGFGYHCQNTQGSDCENHFTDKDAYKQFATIEEEEADVTIMKGSVSKTKQANIIYKINVPGTQPQGVYQNTITYVGIPLY